MWPAARWIRPRSSVFIRGFIDERLRPRRRPQPERPALGVARRRGSHRSRHRPAHGPAGNRRPAARRARCGHRGGERLPRSHAARAAARSVGADRHGYCRRSARVRGAAGRDGRRVRRLRCGWRVQRRADGHAAARARLRGAAPRAGPHDGGLRSQRSGAAFAGAARRQPDRLRRLRHRRGRGAGLHRRRRRHRGAGPPQGRGPAAGDRRHGQSEPAGLHIRPVIAVRRRRWRS